MTLSSFSNYKLSRHSLDWPCRYNLSYFGPSGVRASAVQTKVATILGILVRASLCMGGGGDSLSVDCSLGFFFGCVF